jgi:hypothetical protein
LPKTKDKIKSKDENSAPEQKEGIKLVSPRFEPLNPFLGDMHPSNLCASAFALL